MLYRPCHTYVDSTRLFTFDFGPEGTGSHTYRENGTVWGFCCQLACQSKRSETHRTDRYRMYIALLRYEG